MTLMRVSIWTYIFCGSKISSLTQSFFFFSFHQRAYFSLASGFAGGIYCEIILNWQLATYIRNYSRHLSSLHREELKKFCVPLCLPYLPFFIRFDISKVLFQAYCFVTASWEESLQKLEPKNISVNVNTDIVNMGKQEIVWSNNSTFLNY